MIAPSEGWTVRRNEISCKLKSSFSESFFEMPSYKCLKVMSLVAEKCLIISAIFLNAHITLFSEAGVKT